MYASVLFVHVLAAVLLAGSSFSAPLAHRAVQGAATLGELRSWLAFANRVTRFNPAFAIVLLLTGVYLGSQGWWTTGWFYVAVFAWFANLHLAGMVINGSAKALAAAASGEGPVPDEVDRLRRRKAWEVAEESLLANDVAILYAMIAKPSLAVSILVLVVLNALLIGIGQLRRRREMQPATA